jgi:hypothetical protein
MKLIDSSIIATRLRVAIAGLFAVSNQAASLGYMCPTSRTLVGQIDDRLHVTINDLGAILLEIEPKKIDTGCLSLEDALILDGYQEIKRGLLKSWQFIESREQAIQAIDKGDAQ